jgi:hypothetical protein
VAGPARGDGVELADVAPAEAAQERAERRGRLDREAEDPRRPAGPECGRVVDTFSLTAYLPPISTTLTA